MKNISNKFKEYFFIFILFSSILVFTNIIVEKFFFVTTVQKIAMQNALNKANEREKVLKEFLEESSHLILFLRKLKDFNNYLEDNTSKNKLEDIFLTYIQSHSRFMQVGYIDKNGFEKIRMNRDKKNLLAYKVPDNKLQNKSNRDYFIESKKKPLEKVWFSKFELNVENKNIQKIFTPILRVILPVKYKNKFDGILVINYFMDSFFDEFMDTPLYNMILCDGKGFPLIHYEKGKNWSFFSSGKYNISQEFPKDYKTILNNESVVRDNFVSKKINTSISDDLFLIFKLKESYLIKQNENITFRYTAMATLVPLISFVLTFFLMKIFGEKLFNTKKISELNENLQTISKVAKIGLWEIDWKRENIIWSDELYNIFEIEDKSIPITKERIFSYLSENSKDELQEEFRKSIDEKREYFITQAIITEKGNTKYLQRRGKHYFDDKGEILKSIGSSYDITEQYLSENKYKTLLDFASDGIHILDKEGNLLEFSHSFAQSLGYTNEEMKNFNVRDWEAEIPEKEQEKFVKDILSSPKSFETKHKRKDGFIIDVQVNAKAIEINGEEYIYASQRNITKQKVLEAQINKEKDFISTIIDGANAIITVIDSSGRMIKVNKYAQNFVGYSEKEITSKAYFWEKFLPKDIRPKVLGIIKKAQEGVVVKNSKNSWISKYGEKKIFKWSNTLVQKDDGSMDYLVSIGIDVSEQEKKQELIISQKQEFETIFKDSKDGIAILDLESNFLNFNDAYIQITGYTREELLTKSCIGISVNEDVERVSNAIKEAIEKGFKLDFEKSCIIKSGEKIILNSSISLMPDKKRLLVSTKNVTENMKLLEELKVAKKNAEKANIIKSEFLANMSHEIRTPISGVTGLISLILDMPLEPIQRDYLKKAKKSSNALLSLINDILDYSKIEAGKLDIIYQDFNLEDIFKNISDLFGYETYKKRLELIFLLDENIPSLIIGDSLRLTQILNNLVGNAIKFTKNGYVALKSEIKEINKDEVIIKFCIEDTGIGISAEGQNKLFNTFEQLDTSNKRKYSGSGLGLSITKQLIELMNGRVWVESEEKVGSKFYFEVKFKYIKKFYKKKRNRAILNNKFLIIDDNKIEREYLNNILNSWGIDSILASNEKNALEIINQQKIDCIIINWNSSDTSRLILLEKLKNMNKEIDSIVLISPYNKKLILDLFEKQEFEVTKLLEKPFTPSLLYNKIFDKNNKIIKEKEISTQITLVKRKRALLVEDNETNQIVSKSILEKIGFIIDIANDGNVAINSVMKSSYDIIFMDLQMPNIDGFEATQKIREFNKDIPIIALSAAVMKKDKMLTKEVGMNAHIAKPIIKEELERLVSKFFEVSFTNKQLQNTGDSKLDKLYGIDFKKLMEILSFDYNESLSLIKKYHKNYSNIESKLDALSLKNDEFNSFIHRLKGVSGNIQAMKVYSICSQIEKMKDEIKVSTLIAKLKNEMKKIFESIEANILNHKDENKDEYTIKEINKIIKSLIKDVNEDNFIKSSKIEELIDSLRDRIENKLLEKIDNGFSNYEYENLIEDLKYIQKKLGEI